MADRPALMAKVEVSFALILCFLSLCSLASSPASLAAPLKDAAKKDGDGFETLGKKAGLVRHLCNETGHYNLCVAAVEADPRSNLKSHRKGILHIVMDKTISNATAILEYIDRLLADNTTKMENTTRDSLEGCSSGYDVSIYELKNALSLLELKNVSQYSDLSSALGSMFGTPFDCDQDFIQRRIPAPNPLTGINNCIEDLAETCLVILDVIYRKHPKKAIRVADRPVLMAKVEVSFALILCFLSLSLLVSSPAALAAPLKDVAKKDGDGFETLGKKAGLVRHLCNETGHYNLCVAAVEADPRSNLKSHRKGILRIVMDKTISNATAILEYIDRLLADNTTKMENTTRDSLEGCSSGYDDGIYDLRHALSLLELKNVSQFSEMSSMLNSMFDSPFDCDQDFIQRSIPAPNPLTGINNCVQDLAETCMAILNIVFRKHPKKAIRARLMIGIITDE
ncbi:hypothetical protein RHGRI_008726 [Rhododendron griersonianum]|uniref:Pectinesterase inhibitor domain-containing protein n=1 Tax=Rhododendron griersonianum TaxID=479676 RepID=A0AAV6L177_9ERIC|nr:hypothetical protein RHGRI_008726 [Rhododendron griersonianum]